MPQSPAGSMPQPATAGDLLRQWRDLRGKSQLDLALDTGVSQKHVSFVETGRSTPSRQMIVDLADALNIPLRERNAIMGAAGYAPVYPDEPLDAVAMRPVEKAVDRLLRQQSPFPAVALDRYWNVVATNDATPAFFGRFVDLQSRPKPRNLLHLMFDPAGMQPFLARFEDTAHSLLQRLRRETVGHVMDERTRTLLAELVAYPGVPQALESAPARDLLPMVPLGFRIGDQIIELFSMIATIGTPQTITSQELRLEMMFPVDETAESAYLKFIGRT